jgi:hypothetical protein
MNSKKAKHLKTIAKIQLAEFEANNPGKLAMTYTAYPKTVTPQGMLMPRAEEYPINHVRRLVRAMVRAEKLAKLSGKRAA